MPTKASLVANNVVIIISIDKVVIVGYHALRSGL